MSSHWILLPLIRFSSSEFLPVLFPIHLISASTSIHLQRFLYGGERCPAHGARLKDFPLNYFSFICCLSVLTMSFHSSYTVWSLNIRITKERLFLLCSVLFLISSFLLCFSTLNTVRTAALYLWLRHFFITFSNDDLLDFCTHFRYCQLFNISISQWFMQSMSIYPDAARWASKREVKCHPFQLLLPVSSCLLSCLFSRLFDFYLAMLRMLINSLRMMYWLSVVIVIDHVLASSVLDPRSLTSWQFLWYHLSSLCRLHCHLPFIHQDFVTFLIFTWRRLSVLRFLTVPRLLRLILGNFHFHLNTHPSRFSVPHFLRISPLKNVKLHSAPWHLVVHARASIISRHCRNLSLAPSHQTTQPPPICSHVL